MAKYQPGESGNPAGRPKGTPNKFTSLKKAFFYAFDEWGGQERLAEWVQESKHNERLFIQWLTKMLPSNVGMDEETRQMLYELSEQFAPKVADGKDEPKPPAES